MTKPEIVRSDKYRVSAHLPESFLTWGEVEALGDPMLKAGETETLTIAVTLKQAIPAGQSIELWTHFVSDMQRPQIDDENAPAFFSCESDNVPVIAFVRPDAKVHGPGTYFPYRRYAGVRLSEGAPEGAKFTFKLANASMQTYEETLFNLRFAILEGDEITGYLGDAFYVVWGTGKDHLRVIAPTSIETGEEFRCLIVVRDRYGNKTGDAIDDLRFDVKMNGGMAPLTFSDIVYDADRRHHILRGLKLDQEGTYYLQVALRDDPSIAGESNPIVVKKTWPEKIYWGDVHQHTYFADGRGTPAANYEYAISTSGLDFCAVAPHQEATYTPPWLHQEEAPDQKGWEELVAAAEAHNGDDIVTILGSEAGSLARIAGHMNSYYLDVTNRPELERLGVRRGTPTENPLAQMPRDEAYQSYLDELERSKGEFLLLPHAHACGGPGRWDLPKRPNYQTNVEICSVHGIFEEFYRQWLAHGHFVGVHGSGDNHMTSTGNGNPGWHYATTNGLFGAYAEARTRRGIWDAIKERKTYAVTGNQRIYLDFAINGEEMGAIVVDPAAAREITLDIAGTAPILKVELMRNNEVIQAYRPPLHERRYLRLGWTDSWIGRRVDDSLTTGELSLADGGLSLVDTLNMYHRTDAFVEEDGSVSFRTNGYSGVIRGAIFEVESQGDAVVHFRIEDQHLESTLLSETMEIPLNARYLEIQRPLDAPERVVRPCFTQEPHRPEFTLYADWIDLSWPREVSLTWTDEGGDPAYYYVRIEQIDGNIAWSSPIWFVDASPFDSDSV